MGVYLFDRPPLLFAQGGGKKAPAVLDSCILYAASSYPDWQQELLDRMREGFHDASKKLEKKDILPCMQPVAGSWRSVSVDLMHCIDVAAVLRNVVQSWSRRA